MQAYQDQIHKSIHISVSKFWIIDILYILSDQSGIIFNIIKYASVIFDVFILNFFFGGGGMEGCCSLKYKYRGLDGEREIDLLHRVRTVF